MVQNRCLPAQLGLLVISGSCEGKEGSGEMHKVFYIIDSLQSQFYVKCCNYRVFCLSENHWSRCSSVGSCPKP